MLFDIALSIVIILYLLVAVFAFIATTSEQQRNGIRALGPRLVSAIACLVWPLATAVMVLLQKTSSRN